MTTRGWQQPYQPRCTGNGTYGAHVAQRPNCQGCKWADTEHILKIRANEACLIGHFDKDGGGSSPEPRFAGLHHVRRRGSSYCASARRFSMCDLTGPGFTGP